MSISTPVVRGRLGLPLVVLAFASAVALHLDRSTAWGWVAVGLLLAGTAFVVLRLRRPALRVTAWSAGTVLLAVTASGSHPGPQHRPAAGEGATRGGVVRTTCGPVSRLRTADGAVEVFTGVPYARPPVGELRWRLRGAAAALDGGAGGDGVRRRAGATVGVVVRAAGGAADGGRHGHRRLASP